MSGDEHEKEAVRARRKTDPFEERGVTIVGIRDGRIAWSRLYLEEVEQEGVDIDETVRRMAGRQEDP